jgi:hypothetical protein
MLSQAKDRSLEEASGECLNLKMNRLPCKDKAQLPSWIISNEIPLLNGRFAFTCPKPFENRVRGVK